MSADVLFMNQTQRIRSFDCEKVSKEEDSVINQSQSVLTPAEPEQFSTQYNVITDSDLNDASEHVSEASLEIKDCSNDVSEAVETPGNDLDLESRMKEGDLTRRREDMKLNLSQVKLTEVYKIITLVLKG